MTPGKTIRDQNNNFSNNYLAGVIAESLSQPDNLMTTNHIVDMMTFLNLWTAGGQTEKPHLEVPGKRH